METTTKSQTLAARLGRHLRHNLVAYVALFIAVSLTPLPSYAANMAIGTKGIKNGAVTTPKLANNAVKPAKIAANAVSGPKIADGSVGTADLAAAARGYTKIVTKRVSDAGVAVNARSVSTVVCGAGQIAIGGGAYVAPSGGIPSIGGAAGLLINSLPATTPNPFTFPAGDNETPTAWRTTVENNQLNPSTAYHYAICASK